MARWLLAFPLLVVIGSSADAWALKPSAHRELAEAACAREGMPDAFCRRMGKQTFETDYQEWNDLSAHAQRELGEDRCTAADAALTRIDRLAREVVSKARAGQLEAAAISLGRAVHTIQDECAHHGMTNQEHAFYSLTQQCTGDQVSPDVQPAALACARTRTDQVMALAARALADVSWNAAYDLCTDWSSDQRDKCANASLPSPFMACDFLAEHKDWDGDDSTWDATKVGDALVSAFDAGLNNTQSTRAICGADASAIDPPNPRRPVTDRGKLKCFSTSLGCLGKVDEDGEASAEMSTGGCSTTSSSYAGLLVIALALLPRRRRTDRRRILSR